MADEQSVSNENEDLGIAPHKKLKTDSTSVKRDSVSLKSPGLKLQNGHIQGESTSTSGPEIGRHLRFHSVEQDDVQSSSGNSSNVENGNVTEEDSGNISDSSSHASSGDWQQRPTGVIAWVHTQMMSGADPKKILRYLIPNISNVPPTISDLSLWQLIVSILSEPQRRPKLSHINTLHDVVDLIRKAKNILVLTGAGVSVSCGIPDFRSRDGIYARLAVDFPDLPDPQAMFDISYFTRDPRPFFKFAKEIYPGQFKPSRSHRFISLLQKTGRLLRNYTQNIDTLEQVAGISNVIQCHGSFATASCLRCHHQVDCEVVRGDIFNQRVPHCPRCSQDEELAIMKPDIVFFGESLPEHFHRQMSKDKDQADLLIVIGSSLKVRPVALIPSSLPAHIPQILINREPLPHVEFDIELLGDGDAIVGEICRRLGSEFSPLADESHPLTEINELPNEIPDETTSEKDVNSEGSILPTSVATRRASGSDLTEQCSDMDLCSNSSVAAKTHDVVSMEEKYAPEVVDGVTPSPTLQSEKLLDSLPSKSDGFIRKTSCSNAKSHTNSSDDRHGDAERCQNCSSSGDTSTSRSPLLEGEAGGTGEVVNSGVASKPRDDKKGMWKSRWKQSISKRLPAGTFYYTGGSRYIFPGAEVAPEEEDDSEISDYDPDSPNESTKSSDDESDDATPVGPGGLSSTKRDLRTSSTLHTLQQSFLHSCHDHDHEPPIRITQDKSEEELSPEDASGHLPDFQQSDEDRKAEDSDSISSFPADFSNHLGLNSHSPVVDKEAEKTEGVAEKKDAILPEDLHELITMETLPANPQHNDSRSHSPLPPTLHKILADDPPHSENSTHLLAKSDADVPDTDQILCLPSSSLLPPMENYSARSSKGGDESGPPNDEVVAE